MPGKHHSSIFPAINVENFLNDDGYFQTYRGIMYPRNSTLNKVEDLFVMCNWQIGLESVQNHLGLETLLQCANLSVYVPAKEFHAILSEHPKVSGFLSRMSLLPRLIGKHYEPRILEAIRTSGELRQEAYRCLLELKKVSLSSTHITWEPRYDDLFETIVRIQRK